MRRAEQRRFGKASHIPKRMRRTRRELPYGQVRSWGATVGNFKREREHEFLTTYLSTNLQKW